MSALLNANIDLIKSLEIAMEQQPPVIFQLISFIKENIETGMTLSNSLEKFPNVFDEIYRGLVHAGEQSGKLAKIFEILSEYQEKSLVFRTKMLKSLFYPVTVSMVGLLIIIGLMIFVVPQFKNIFNNFNAQLPWFTEFVIFLATQLKIQITFLLFFLLVIFFSHHYFLRNSEKYHSRWDHVYLKFPILGQLCIATNLAKWSRLMSTLLSAELPLILSLNLANQIIINKKIHSTMALIVRQITSGHSFSSALAEHSFLPRTIIQMIIVGEAIGQLNEVMNKIADQQQLLVDQTVEQFSKWIEPIIILILAIVMGSLIIAMYLPVFKLGSVL